MAARLSRALFTKHRCGNRIFTADSEAMQNETHPTWTNSAGRSPRIAMSGEWAPGSLSHHSEWNLNAWAEWTGRLCTTGFNHQALVTRRSTDCERWRTLICAIIRSPIHIAPCAREGNARPFKPTHSPVKLIDDRRDMVGVAPSGAVYIVFAAALRRGVLQRDSK